MDLFYKNRLINIDEEDRVYLSMYNWYITENNYLVYKPYKQSYVRFHRLILNCPENMSVDHIDGNRLNNCKSNLRICTHQENMHNRKIHKNNTSGYKGVCWCKRKNKWVVNIRVNNVKKTIGRYDSIIDAALAYDEAAIKYFGEFASTNF